MHCPQCHADNPGQASACLKCGAPLALICPRCGTELPPQANFCFHCGSPVTAPAAEPDEDTLALLQRALQRLAPQGYAQRLLATRGQVARERRTVTLLFCDVQGSTSLAESLDPEEVMDVIDGAFDVLIPPIYRYEGTVARLMGDAVLAFFGAPIAHEDDPSVLAARPWISWSGPGAMPRALRMVWFSSQLSVDPAMSIGIYAVSQGRGAGATLK